MATAMKLLRPVFAAPPTNISSPPIYSKPLQSSLGSGGAGGANNWLGCLLAQMLCHFSPCIVSAFRLVGLNAVSTGSSIMLPPKLLNTRGAGQREGTG